MYCPLPHPQLYSDRPKSVIAGFGSGFLPALCVASAPPLRRHMRQWWHCINEPYLLSFTFISLGSATGGDQHMPALCVCVCVCVHTSELLLASLLPDDAQRRVTHSANALAQTAGPVEIGLQAELTGPRRRTHFRPDPGRRSRALNTRCARARRLRLMHRAVRLRAQPASVCVGN